jgi:glycerate kinase
MRIIVAPDSFKGSLSALQAANAIERGIQTAASKFGKKTTVIKIPMADGGEGTVSAIITAVGGKVTPTTVLDPLGRLIESFFGVLPDNTGVIEMAAASGLNLIEPGSRDPLVTTTFGTGQLIKAVLDAGCNNIIIGIGGSATNDGGVGMAQALGIKFLDKKNKPVGFGGGELGKIHKMDLSGLDPRVNTASFTVASDVKNLLCGPEGASAVYGPQKGATSKMVTVLDRNLLHLAGIIKLELGIDIAQIPGSGAAGGLGGGLMAFLGAKLQPGIKIVMELTQFETQVREADCLVTGEGATDFQTIFGKVPYGVAQVAVAYQKPVICISGTLGKGYEKLAENGITAFFSIINQPMTLAEAMQRGEELLEKTAENVFCIYLLGG